MRDLARVVVAAFILVLGVLVSPLAAQVASTPVGPQPMLVQPAPFPATRLEGFPEINSLVTLGYDRLGIVGGGKIFVDVREVRDTIGNSAGGVTVRVQESQERQERSFVDAEEIPELLKGLDALLALTANPTQFKRFEMRYTTKGNLAFVAYSNTVGAIEYSVQAGRPLQASIVSLDAVDMLKMRSMFDAALQKLITSGPLPSSGGGREP